MEFLIKFIAFISIQMIIWINVEGDPIKDGTEVRSTLAHPYMASIRKKVYKGNEPMEHVCGAAIIDARYVLTAAHCIKKYKPEKFGIIAVGTVKTKAVSQENIYEIEEAIIHKSYDENRGHGRYAYDIGLIKLKRGIRFSNTVKRFRYLDTQDMLRVGDSVTVMGFGYTGPGDECQIIPEYLQELDVKVDVKVQNMIITRTYRRSQQICESDSGSPIVKIRPDGQATLVGIVIEAEGNKMYGASIYKLQTWIVSQMEDFGTDSDSNEISI